MRGEDGREPPKEHPPIPGGFSLGRGSASSLQPTHEAALRAGTPRGCRRGDRENPSAAAAAAAAFFFISKRGAKSENNKIVFSSVLESTWINNGSRNWAAETINFLWTQPKKDAGRRWLPGPGEAQAAARRLTEVGGGCGGGGEAAVLCSPSALIQSICSQQIRRRLCPEQSSLLRRGSVGKRKEGPRSWRELPRAPAPGRALEAAASLGRPRSSQPKGAGDPPEVVGATRSPLCLGSWGLFPSPRHARGVASSLASCWAISDGENYCSNPRLLFAQEK